MLTLIVTGVCDVDAIAVSLVAVPLSYVLLSFAVLPESIALHGTVIEVAYIILVSKFEPSLSVGPIVLKVPDIDRPVGKLHIPFTSLEI
jgi:hypothetical protein